MTLFIPIEMILCSRAGERDNFVARAIANKHIFLICVIKRIKIEEVLS